MLKEICKFPELEWLKTGDINCTPDGGYFEGMEYKRTKAGTSLLLSVCDDDYSGLTDCQGADDKLSHESFNEIKAFVKESLKTDNDINAMLVNLVINDLGKVNSFVKKVSAQLGIESVDHDVVLFEGLSAMPELSPSFDSLDAVYKDIILKGMKTAFNMGQFVQSESGLNNLQEFMDLDRGIKDFYLIHSLFDIAGAAGHIVNNGSPILTESYWRNFKAAKDAIYNNTLDIVAEADYVSARGKMIGIDASSSQGCATVKLCNMARVNTVFDAAKVSNALRDQPEQVMEMIVKELAWQPRANPSILLYYLPAVLCNCIKACGDVYTGVYEVLPILASLYGNVRNAASCSDGSVVVASVRDVAETAKRPKVLKNSVFSISKVEDDFEINVSDKEQVIAETVCSFDVKGDNVLVIGIGGGTDSVQGAMVAKHLLPCRCGAIVSIRSSRTVTHPKCKICTGTYEIGSFTKTNNRYIEDIPYKMGYKTYLIVDSVEDDSIIVEGVKSILSRGKYDSILCIDTGGDCMFSSSINDKSYSPDQDRKVLNAILTLDIDVPIQLAIVAPDIDAPNGKISDTLKKANAKLYEIPEDIANNIVTDYNCNGMDGSDPVKFGKTQLIWKAALSGKAGIVTVDIPLPYVLDNKNVWIPTAIITEATRKIALCNAAALLEATR